MEQAVLPSLRYRPHLDGLRAVAVYLVVAFHAGIGRLSGGFIGVDVFFVLSGYLVTSLLLRDVQGAEQRVRFARFYSRRARRLLPAASVNLLVTAVVFAAIAAPVELGAARDGIRAAALYVVNWHFIQQSADYFASDIDASPVAHYWSLSIEEQFYLLWPLVIAGLFAVTRRFGPRQIAVVRGIVVLAGAASLSAAVVLAGSNLDRAYYGTDTRAYQLLAGALIALTPGLIGRLRGSRVNGSLGVASAAALLGLLVVSTSSVDLQPVTRGAVATVVTVVVIVSLEGSRKGIVRSVLSWSPLTYLGRISYGTYLWHWLIVVVLGREAELTPRATLAVTAVVATGLASASYQLLEHPIRSSSRLDRVPPVVVSSALAVSLAIGLVLAPRLLDAPSGGTELVAPQAAVGGAAPDNNAILQAFLDRNDGGSCEASSPEACPLTAGGSPTARKAIIIGESHAWMLSPMLVELLGRHDVDLFGGYLNSCPWTRGLAYAQVGRDCLTDQEDLFGRIVPALDPDIVFLAHRAVDDANDPLPLRDGRRRGFLEGGTADQEAALEASISSLIAELRADGRTVVMFEPIPVADPVDNPLTCLSESKAVEACRFVAASAPGGQERVMRRAAAADPSVVSVDLDRLVCPYLPICDPVVGGLIVRADTNHLTLRFAATLLDPVDEYLTGQGVFERSPAGAA